MKNFVHINKYYVHFCVHLLKRKMSTMPYGRTTVEVNIEVDVVALKYANPNQLTCLTGKSES